MSPWETGFATFDCISESAIICLSCVRGLARFLANCLELETGIVVQTKRIMKRKQGYGNGGC